MHGRFLVFISCSFMLVFDPMYSIRSGLLAFIAFNIVQVFDVSLLILLFSAGVLVSGVINLHTSYLFVCFSIPFYFFTSFPLWPPANPLYIGRIRRGKRKGIEVYFYVC